MAIRVMKHSATGSHALGTGSTAATASAHPLPHPPRHAGPPARTPPQRGGSPGRSSQPTSTQPCADRGGSEPRRPRPQPRVTFPVTPSRLPACTPGAGERSGARLHAGTEERGPRSRRRRPPRRRRRSPSWPGPSTSKPLRAPGLLPLRGAGPASVAKGGGQAPRPRKGKSARARLTPPPPPLSQREARSQRRCRAGRRQRPHGESGQQPAGRAGGLQLPACHAQAALPGGGAHARSRALPGGVAGRACGACWDGASHLNRSRGGRRLPRSSCAGPSRGSASRRVFVL